MRVMQRVALEADLVEVIVYSVREGTDRKRGNVSARERERACRRNA